MSPSRIRATALLAYREVSTLLASEARATIVEALERWKERATHIAAEGADRPASSATRGALLLVVVALVVAAIDHGAFFASGFRITVLIVLAAAFVSLGHRAFQRHDVGAPLVAVVALAVWYLVAAAIAGRVRGATPAVALFAAMASILVVVPRAPARDRERLLWGLLLTGVAVALSGWIGFVTRHQPLAIPDTCCGGIWRAATTITYANGAAAFLVPCICVALALLDGSRHRLVVRLVVFVLLVGFVATFSRGGAVALLVGIVVLALLGGANALVRAIPSVLGAAVASTALLSSVRLTEHRQLVLALVAFAAGAVVAGLPNGRVMTVVVVVCALGVVSVPGVRTPIDRGWSAVARGRLTVSSPDRSKAVDAALRLAGRHPVAGVGPGEVDLTWPSTNPLEPGTLHLRYAHDEYVQVLVESGGVGLTILIAGLLATGWAVWRHRRDANAVAAAGCIAALTALAVHSATDYLWHIALIPLTGAVLVAVVLPRPPPATNEESAP
jgi:hypothetical protein